MVELLSVAHEEVDEQEQHEERGDEQVADRHTPAHKARSCQAETVISISGRSKANLLLSDDVNLIVHCRSTKAKTHCVTVWLKT